MMCNYIKFCANRLVIALGCSRYYKIGNPFEWMETISLQGKTNFFEKRVGEYSISGVGVDRADQTFALNASFWPPLASPHPTFIIHLSLSTCYTPLCSQLEHQLSPPFPHLCFQGFTKTILTGVKDVYQSPMIFLAEGIHTPPCPKAISPRGSVMII